MKLTESLRKNYEFKIVYNRGKSFANKHLVLYIRPNGLKINRLGISVSKKVGKSVVRSRVTRLIRESYRLNEDNITKGYDLVILARNMANEIDFRQMEKSLCHLMRKLDMIDKKNSNQKVNNKE